MKRMLIATLGLAWSFPATALELPQLDPEARCDAIAGPGSSMYKQVRHYCIDQEQAAYDRLKDEWPEASEEDQRRTLAMLKSLGKDSNSYSGLEGTLRFIIDQRQASERAKRMKGDNHFRRD